MMRCILELEELAGFAAFLRENEVPCVLDEAAIFLAEGRSYRFGRLQHPYDLEAAQNLYRTWRRRAEV
jgi:hypothetical protein